jgi:hypothetical protein
MSTRDERFESDQVFCSNPSCLLYVAPGGLVPGAGNWAVLENGAMIGRGRYLGKMYCDPCGIALLHPPIQPSANTPEIETSHARNATRAG